MRLCNVKFPGLFELRDLLQVTRNCRDDAPQVCALRGIDSMLSPSSSTRTRDGIFVRIDHGIS